MTDEHEPPAFAPDTPLPTIAARLGLTVSMAESRRALAYGLIALDAQRLRAPFPHTLAQGYHTLQIGRGRVATFRIEAAAP